MVPAPYSVIGWGSAATNFTPPGIGQSIIWTVTNGTGGATIQQSTGAIRGATGDVTVNYKIVDNNTRVVAYKSAPVTVTIQIHQELIFHHHMLMVGHLVDLIPCQLM